MIATKPKTQGMDMQNAVPICENRKELGMGMKLVVVDNTALKRGVISLFSQINLLFPRTKDSQDD